MGIWGFLSLVNRDFALEPWETQHIKVGRAHGSNTAQSSWNPKSKSGGRGRGLQREEVGKRRRQGGREEESRLGETEGKKRDRGGREEGERGREREGEKERGGERRKRRCIKPLQGHTPSNFSL
jgi:hypothetical protein